ncbi:hypothetical protein SAMN05443665_103821 [Actinomadura meyerae]|uniref:Abi-like protein n=1 Tax=Actinomadura meyerae TaxID=240840 RepID=A0A239NAD0_9ACTN|nr:hypothetical protein [Actinomadura meyerae]SNT51720.1 hypothetical protein SAMN05443665_103821 [Actinomadura meyerae]
MNGHPPVWLPQALSQARFASYVTAAAGDPERARRLYWWNLQASAAFYGPLHCLEVALRNALHERLREKYGREDWWSAAPLSPEGGRKVARARANARKNSARRAEIRPLVPDDVVAELTFGFWVELLSRRNDRSFWVPCLHRAFPGYSGRRDGLHRDLLSTVLLRNRVMHYEPIHHRDLAKDHQTVYRLMQYISPELAGEARRLDRVPDVLSRRTDVCAGVHSSSF